MTDSLLLPVCLDRIVDTNGVPINGARVFVYDAGTTDLKNVYTNATLATAAANPIVGDAGGYLTARYIGTGSYKLVIKDPVGSSNPDDWVTLKTEDDLPGALNTAPFSVSAAKPVTPVISTATSRLISVAELGSVVVCDPTGGNIVITLPNAADAGDGKRLTVIHEGTAGQVSIEEATPITVLYTPSAVTVICDAVEWREQSRADPNTIDRVPTPQCYLTLVPVATDPINPVPTSDQVSKTTVYCRPFGGDRMPIFNGMTFIPRQFAELELTLVSQHEASGIYDVFADWSGTAVRVGTGPKWSTVTAGSGARGTGGSTTELALVQGRLVNANEITVRNGGTTYTVAANRGTYVGSILIDGSAGQITCHRSYGQSRKWGVWNAYNRRPIILKGGDSTASWTYATATVRASNNASANSITILVGLQEEMVEAIFSQFIQANFNGAAGIIGIGMNSTTAISGTRGTLHDTLNVASLSGYIAMHVLSRHSLVAAIGRHNIQALETTNSSTITFNGTEDYMRLSARFMG